MKNKQELVGVDLLIHDLETTRLGFTDGEFHIVEDGKCKFCAEGVLIKKSGVTVDKTQDDFPNLGREMYKVEQRYGLNIFSPLNEDEFYETDVECPECGNELRYIGHVITHMNDQHSKSHKETAKLIKNLHEKYDLITGEPRK